MIDKSGIRRVVGAMGLFAHDGGGLRGRSKGEIMVTEATPGTLANPQRGPI